MCSVHTQEGVCEVNINLAEGCQEEDTHTPFVNSEIILNKLAPTEKTLFDTYQCCLTYPTFISLIIALVGYVYTYKPHTQTMRNRNKCTSF